MRWGYKAVRLLCRAIWRTAFRLEVSGLENVPPEGQGVLLASNHQSFLDPITIGVALRREINPVARESLFHNPLFRSLIRYLNAFPIQRSSADMAAVREGIRRLKNADALVLFPEATRTRDGRIGRISPGFALLAKKACVPIVPVLIDGAFECWPRSRKRCRFSLFAADPGSRVAEFAYGSPTPAVTCRCACGKLHVHLQRTMRLDAKALKYAVIGLNGFFRFNLAVGYPPQELNEAQLVLGVVDLPAI